ncbi:hypothetical protein H0G86_010750 [Trichoderma simmonsii]|uniref:Uncharacterized protein n=1 Tax=Trichoderma simmonsii TaxID=1491479 RepID=A0A8G0PJM4_9HYPO|nr:hypothetical protein H0G86_010750 [Trichoderma simmonsii]
MSGSSTRAYNGSNVASNDDATTADKTVHDHELSYNLDRFLSDMDQNHPPGYGQPRSPAESEERMQKLLDSIEAKLPPSSDTPHPNDPPHGGDPSTRN